MLINYLKIAFKVMLRRKFYTFVSLFGIAFTLLILNLVVAMADYSLSSRAPEVHLDRLLIIDRAKGENEHSSYHSGPGYALLDRYARGLPGAENFTITSSVDIVTSFLNGKKIESRLRRTDGAFWEVMQFTFVEGGPFTRADETQQNFVAVINERTRERFFGGPPAVGRELRADGQTFTVVGVVRDVPITRPMSHSEIWIPISIAKSPTYREELLGSFQGIVLAEERSKFPMIKEEFRSRLASAELPDPDLFDRLQSGAFTPLEMLARGFFGVQDFETAPLGRMILAIAAGALLFMLLPALNMINLSLSRILERSSEIGVRKAFGASSWGLVGQFLVEGIVLSLVGGAIGLALSVLVIRVITGSDLIPYAQLTINVRVFLYGLVLTLVFAVLSGAYPAWRMSRLHPVEALHGRAR
jgi:putative ABC transport system permease protein